MTWFTRSPARGLRLLVLALSAIPWAWAADRPVRILPLGDSITRGNNDINYPNGDIPGGYRRKLGTELKSAGVEFDFVGPRTDNPASGMDPDHAGYQGVRTDEILERLPTVLSSAPDVVLLHAGTNDLLQGVPTGTAASNLDVLIERTLSGAPLRKLYVSTLIPITQSWGTRTANQLNAEATSYNIQLKAIVKKHADLGRKVYLVDTNALIVPVDDSSQRFFLPGDGIHPGQAGYDQMGSIWFKAIAPSMAEPIANGGFELGWTAWTSSGGVTLENPSIPSSPGQCAAVFRRNATSGAGMLSQVFPTESGLNYDLVFDVGAAGADAGRILEVRINGGVPLVSRSIPVTGSDDGIQWQSQRVSFVADGSEAQVVFNDLGAENHPGFWLDGVELVKRPQRTSAAVMDSSTLRAHPRHPRIFEFRGRPTLLRTFGEHYSSVINTGFDYVSYLDVLQRDELNLTRAFLVGFRHDGDVFAGTPLAPAPARFLQPWMRSSIGGGALDGLGKWDFNTWNEEYFARLRAFARAASDRGVVIEFTLFCTPYTTSDWKVSPFNPSNNLQGFGPADRYDALRGADARLLAAQEAAVRRIVTELNDFDNIYYEVLNEPFWNEPGIKDDMEIAFQNRMLQIIRDTESSMSRKHLVAHNFPQRMDGMSDGFDIINEHYPLPISFSGADPAIGGAEALLNNQYGSGKILAFDETHTTSPLQTRLEAWMFFHGGGAVYNGLDVPHFVYSEQDSSGDSELGRDFRKPVRDIGRYLDQLEITALRRELSWVKGTLPDGTTVQAMASEGQQYAAYFHQGTNSAAEKLSYTVIDGTEQRLALRVDLPEGSWRAVWTRPSDLSVIRSDSFDHAGGERTLTEIVYQEDVALRLDRTGAGDLTPPPAPSGLNGSSDASGAIQLSWRAAESADHQGYWVYRFPTDRSQPLPGDRIAEIVGGPAAFLDSTVVPGSTWRYVVTAIDNQENESIGSRWIDITSTLDNLPFGAAPLPVPGRIEAEDFDRGGRGIAWNDLSPGNHGGAYRPSEDVDIEPGTDDGGGYQVTGTEAGEWLEYTVQVERTGNFTLEVRVHPALSGAVMRLESNGIDLSGPIVIPQADGWRSVVVPNLVLEAGTRVLRWVIVSNGGNGSAGAINWFSFQPGSVLGPTAQAGSDFQVTDQNNDGSETVMLNAGASLSGDAPIESYTWMRNGQTIASGVSPTVNLPPGKHRIQLRVIDAYALESMDEVTVTVRPGGFINGGFEDGLLGWTSSGNLAVQARSPYVPAEGSRLLAFNSANLTPNGWVSQTFGTVPGAAYTLAFDVGVISYNTQSQTMRVTVSGATSLLDRSISITGLGGGSNHWLARSFTFVADSATTTIAFRDLSTATVNLDLMLDNIRLSGPPPAVPNTAAFAANDNYSIREGESLFRAASGVLENDSDPDGDLLTVRVDRLPQNGLLLLNPDGSFSYQPSAGFYGTDRFTYRVTDGEADSNVATVTIEVIEVVPSPIAVEDLYAVNQDQTLVVPTNLGLLANDSDARSRPLAALLDVPPVHGDLVLEASGGMVYQPDPGFFGADFFIYHVSNGVKDSAPVIVHITVLEVVPPPVALPDAYATDQNVMLQVAAPGVLGNDRDPRDAQLVAILDQAPVHGELVLNEDGSFTYLPSENSFSADSFTYRAGNGRGVSPSVRVDITMTVDGVVPEITAAPDFYQVLENGRLEVVSAIGVLANDVDVLRRGIEARLHSGPAHGSLSLNPDGSLVYIPESGYFGEDSFVYRAANGSSVSNLTTVRIQVQEIGPAPVALPDGYSVAEGSSLVVASAGVLVNDADFRSRTLSAIAVSVPVHGVLELNADGGFVYTPDPGFFGVDSFTYRVTNGLRVSEEALVELTVMETVPPPVARADFYQGRENVSLVVPGAGVLMNDDDLRGRSLSAVLRSAPRHGTVSLSPDGGFTYVPRADFFGEDSFTYQSSNGVRVSEDVRVSLTLEEVVPAPIVVADAYETPSGTPLEVAASGVLANDRDPRSRTLGATVVTGPLNGNLSLRADGGFNYVPVSGFSGSDSFTYRASNGIRESDLAIVNLVVRPPIPQGLVNGSFESGLSGWTTTGNLGIQSSSPYSATQGTRLVAFNGANLAPNGVLSQRFGTIPGQSYTLAFDVGVLAFNTQTQVLRVSVDGVTSLLSRTISVSGPGNGSSRWFPQSFTFVADGPETLLSFSDRSTTTLNLDLVLDSVSVVGLVNTAPSSADDSYVSARGLPLAVGPPGVLANDSDPEGDSLTAALVTGPVSGTLILNPDGGFVYTPAEGFTGTDSFTYRAGDGKLNAPLATVNLTINDVVPGSLINGSFEAGLSGWTLTGNAGILSTSLYTATDGTRLLGFNSGNSNPNAVLSQSVATVPGQSYSVSFDVGTLAFNTLTQSVQFSVTGNASLLSRSITMTGAGNGSNRWQSQNFTFVADSAATVIAFRDQSAHTIGLDLTLDNVRLAATPAAVNSAPTAVSDSYVTTRDQTLVIAASGVLGNDTDPEGDRLIASLVAGPANGSVVLAADGGFTYVPAAGFVGTDSFSYRSGDGRLTSSIVVVTIQVHALAAASLVNGSFESGLSGWTSSGNLGLQSLSPYSATQGSTLLVFNSGNRTPNGVLSQTFATTPGASYALAFDVGVLSFNGNSQVLQVTVRGNASLLARTITVTGNGLGSSRWQAQSFVFTADGSSATLEFRDQSATTSNLDLLLDHVRVSGVSARVSEAPAIAALSVVTEEPPMLPPASPRVSGVPGEIKVSTFAHASGIYHLERSQDLIHWQRMSESSANAGDPVEFVDQDPAPPSRMFYRIGFIEGPVENRLVVQETP